MQDVRTRKGADITPDNHLAVANLKRKQKKKLKNLGTALQRFMTILYQKKHHHNEWNCITTLDKIEERRNTKTTNINSRIRAEKIIAQAEYIKVNKQVKKYVEVVATTTEKAARQGNMKQLYDTAKKLAGKYSKSKRPVKDKEVR
ncbi:unnamed protein product [Schistosoma margrebowiei]|uniref:Uncharacterized protein n=1 Tax=Schistosoma margrebowiei TaxID=48269 RepID=A0A183N6A6_9TREM|nr:unnamed protein product [Schistosoma margrebowiei]